MLTLDQIQTVHNDVMFDEMILATAAQIIDAEDVDTRVAVAEQIATMTIVMTLDKLSNLVADIPSAHAMQDAIMSKMVNDFIDSLDN